MKEPVVFIAANSSWSIRRTRDEFARREASEITAQADGTFTLAREPARRYRVALFAAAEGGWVFAVVEDRE